MRSRFRLSFALVAAVALGSLGVESAHAQNDGSLVSLLDGASTKLLGNSALPLLNSPSVVLACFPSGQTGTNNHFNGTQNVHCSQSATQTDSGGGNGGGGITGYEVINAGTFDLAAGESDSAAGFCPEGKRPLSGGAQVDGGVGDNLRLNYSYPHQIDPREWVVGVTNEGDSSVQGRFFVICANVAE
ncbi:hypothetical protein RM704_15290 [Streptomyces sp. DSM 3412]|uniref:Secreted protein n=1 Tax=Streptomyces gottesmaniae TaxID=3075518 RepID=A0ABU2YY36_9ACTN|nr:hypothetical protein [Streptomyces sp. DSM 3412]MDT0568818.1 hypothetical protein [Streptomyces sp. DSM 3412]